MKESCEYSTLAVFFNRGILDKNPRIRNKKEVVGHNYGIFCEP